MMLRRARESSRLSPFVITYREKRLGMADSLNTPLPEMEGENHPAPDRAALVSSMRSSETATNVEAESIASPFASSTEAVDDTTNETSSPPRTSRRLGLQPRDQVFVGLLAGVLLVLSGIHAFKASRWSLQPVELSHHPERAWEFHLDINTATWVEWMQLEGIGERLAVRIVEDRETNGRFTSIDDLDRVNGIGPKTIEKLRPHLRCEPVDTTSIDEE